MGDLEFKRDSSNFIGTHQGGGWTQGALDGTRALDHSRVQANEGSLLWVPLCVVTNCQLEKSARHRSCELSSMPYLTEDCSLRDSLSDSSKELLMRGRERGQCTCDFGQRVCTISGEGNGNPLQYSCLENPMDRGVWWAIIHGVAKSRTRLSDFCVCVCVCVCTISHTSQ